METVIIREPQELLDALAGLIREPPAPGLRLGLQSRRSNTGGVLVLDLDGRRLEFNVKVRLSATRRDLDHPTWSPNDLLAVTHLTHAMVKLCAERGLSAIGLNGRVWIRQPGLALDIKLPLHGRHYCTPEPVLNYFAARSSRLARALLSARRDLWTITELAQATSLSLSRVSNLLNAFKKEGWVAGSRGDWRLAAPDALLDAWAEADDWSKRGSLKQYASIQPKPNAMARALRDLDAVPVAFTQWFAANLRHPHTTTQICSAYRARHLTPDEAGLAGFREVSGGGSLWIVVPRDDGVFQFGQEADGIPLVADVQIYLDLLQAGLRGPDQARVLREWSGFRK
jgi:hypothetical protein